jgi:hypothetical protein
VSESHSGISAGPSAGDVVVPLSTIDEQVRRLNLTVRFVKADIEGTEMQMLRDAMKTIKEQRPVLALSLGYNEQMLELPWLIERIGGYRMQFMFLSVDFNSFDEFTVFAYPEEVMWTGGK